MIFRPRNKNRQYHFPQTPDVRWNVSTANATPTIGSKTCLSQPPPYQREKNRHLKRRNQDRYIVRLRKIGNSRLALVFIEVYYLKETYPDETELHETNPELLLEALGSEVLHTILRNKQEEQERTDKEIKR